MANIGNLSTSTNIGGRGFEWGARTYVMGIVNVTTDSFSGDGLNDDVDAAISQALAFQEAGAHLIDIGGESTRPPGATYGQGAAPVSADRGDAGAAADSALGGAGPGTACVRCPADRRRTRRSLPSRRCPSPPRPVRAGRRRTSCRRAPAAAPGRTWTDRSASA